ncbi:hypothetical protein BB560_005846 [Smittium megazygosporum]|uniref:Ribosomal protein/NADH dehydrogenase domain-containing protein n=1 Tax=Smittium megazygosporum TaxID=133381 RepID=A0A2T9YTS7_9FUNG|nr:hypothetical protein BB560_006467 [Smittium megazygosporum]PVU95750.1 hypothetical protein BB560_005846 [Smittium megazygosporum]
MAWEEEGLSSNQREKRYVVILKMKLPVSLKEIRLFMCPKSPASAGLRASVLKNYPRLRANNPKVPILIREVENVTPKMFARFDRGVEKSVSVADLQEKEVDNLFHKLISEENVKALK